MADIETPGNSQGEHNLYDWKSIEHDDEFHALIQKKRSVILPLTIIFIVYYFGFLILVGYFPAVVETEVIGHINIAYLFALSQFIVAWIIVYIYVRQANGFDQLVQRLVNKIKGGKR
jgi:uncharacterized membrane protein (DUF485 family)